MTIKIGPLNLVTILLVVLKLNGTIAWSWWWVTAPTWIPWAVVLVFHTLASLL